MKEYQFTDNNTESKLKKSNLIQNTVAAIANGDMLIDVRIDTSPSPYHPWLSELQNEFSPENLDESFILDKAVLVYTGRGSLGMSTGNFLENALNGNVKQLKKDIDKHAVDLKFNENNVMTDFKIKLKDISVINIMKLL